MKHNKIGGAHLQYVPGVTLPPCRGLWGTLHIWGRY